MNECYTHCLPLYEVTLQKRRKKGYENMNKNKIRWFAKGIRYHPKERNCTSNAVSSEHNVGGRSLSNVELRKITARC